MNMKKSLIALAVASAFVAPAAMAEATVYGQMHLSIDMANNGATPSAKTNQLNNRTSHLGFKGAEDLGSGLSAVWQIESDIAADDGATTSLGGRNTFLGLKSDSLGSIMAGRHDTPYKMATRNLDVFADTAADNRTDLVRIFVGDLQAGMAQRLRSGGQGELDRAVEAFGLFLFDHARVRLRVEVLDLAGDTDSVPRSVKLRERACAGNSFEQILPGGGHVEPQRGDHA